MGSGQPESPREKPVPRSGQGVTFVLFAVGFAVASPSPKVGGVGSETRREQPGWGADTPSPSPCPHTRRRLAGLAASRPQGHPLRSNACKWPAGHVVCPAVMTHT